jgi:hypothetical protein
MISESGNEMQSQQRESVFVHVLVMMVPRRTRRDIYRDREGGVKQ